ncbi:hypothetical protein BU24DRAFT_412479 [Aaosphaeria arxii CBS 175.79]|uniref:Cyclase n=1 Tax=Aaosphaeria arxii CBS 175.79 TaxID=1450172 RepID=A0A6A5XG78_9PLEO|nr:uncharacterized protein BU24DRAFT_412479 [Aaosphaeria arxii CBS 175.79]KAF2011933.1 hypothetical protein BU24DRAFT_412479 [Aaosphaeria arxii CBS 175.79]
MTSTTTSPTSRPQPPRRPPFSTLPLDPSGPASNAWGLYGPSDELGALNILTPAVVLSAAQSTILTGHRVSLDWPLNLPSHPSFDRPSFQWQLTNRTHPDGTKRTVNDDSMTFNTQSSSQWDGFRHYGYQKAGLYYGGRTQGDVESSEVIGIDKIAKAGGIAARGVILDYPRWRAARGQGKVDALAAVAITAGELKAMVRDAGVETREGDVLLLRTGFTEAYLGLDGAGREALGAKRPAEFMGVESTREVAEWIWESGFVAVAGDAPSFEMSPLVGGHNEVGGIWKGESWEEEMQGGGLLHQWLLGGWGVMIGEMWDLEGLCEKAVELGRNTCFLSSVPLKVPGGVASPPNAVAFF